MPRGIYERKPVSEGEIWSRFMAKVSIQENGCWEWAGCLTHGYGIFHVPGTKNCVARAHEFAYQHLVSPVPEGLELDHLCHNPKCVNPKHLDPVTHQENMIRGLAFNSNRGNCLKTHCIQGHPFNETNTYIGKDGHRHCLACLKERSQRYYRLKKQAKETVCQP